MKIYPPHPWKKDEAGSGESRRREALHVSVFCSRDASRRAGEPGPEEPPEQAKGEQVVRTEEMK